MTYSTYTQLIDDIHSEIHEQDKLSFLADEQIAGLINNWQEKMSRRLNLRGEIAINLKQAVTQYQLDTNAETMAQPMVFKRVVNGFIRTVEYFKRDEFQNKQVHDSENLWIYSSYDCPFMFTDWMKDGNRYIEVYPAPLGDEADTIYYRKIIIARDLSGKALTSELLIPSEYEDALKFAVEANIYRIYLKDAKQYAETMRLYEQTMVEIDRNVPATSRIVVTYW